MGEAAALLCHTALLPGGLSAITRSLPADTVLSYGASSRNTLTLSSLEEQRASVAIQREFISLDGHAVERQELVLPMMDAPQTCSWRRACCPAAWPVGFRY